MAAKPLTIGRLNFARQMDALKFFKDMLGKYSRGDVVIQSDEVDLRALLSQHARLEEKVGSGVDFFEVGDSAYRGKCFLIVRTDGSRVDFSYKKCVTQLWD